MTVDRKQFPLDFGGAYPLPAPPESNPFVILLQSELNSAGFTANLLGAIRALSNPNVFNTDDYDAALSAASAYAAIEVVMADLCATIADCIYNSPATRQAILDLYNELPALPSDPQPSPQPSPQALDNLLEFSDCSDANIYAYCLQLVQLFDAVVTDSFQIFEAASNNLSLLAAVFTQVPILGGLADVAIKLQENIGEGYAAGYSVTLEQEIACDLYCIAKTNCSLTLEQVGSYYAGQLGAAIFDNFEDVMQYVTLGVYSGALAVYAAHFALIQVLRFGGSWAGNSLAGILRLMVGLQNDSNNDYVLCDCVVCGGFGITVFNADNSGITRGGVANDDLADGYYVPAVGHTVAVNNRINRIDIRVFRGASNPNLKYSFMINGVRYDSTCTNNNQFNLINCAIPEQYVGSFTIQCRRCDNDALIDGGGLVLYLNITECVP